MDEQIEKEIIDNANEIALDMINTFNLNKNDKDWIKEGFFEEEKYISVYYGNILGINPSGKYYTCWTTNQTEEDVNEDSLTWETIEEKLSELNLWVESGEGDALDIFICGNIEEDIKEGDD
jgi:hypothetical protein